MTWNPSFSCFSLGLGIELGCENRGFIHTNAVHAQAKADIKELMGLGDDYEAMSLSLDF